MTADAVGSGMLFGFWYRAMPGDALRRGGKARVSLLETALLVGRDEAGQAFALVDACPHRGMPLSYGRFDGRVLQCGYHGWTFDVHSGRCLRIPSLLPSQEAIAGKIQAGSLPCEERDGFVWVYVPEEAPCAAASSNPPGPPPSMPVFSTKYRTTRLSTRMPVSADHGLTSLLDPAHGPFVHGRWWRLVREPMATIEREFVPIPLGFREKLSTPIRSAALRRYVGADETTVVADFVLPNIRIGLVRAGHYWWSILVTVTPITQRSCCIDLSMAWNAFYWMPFGAPLLQALFRLFAVQDRDAMAKQAKGLVRDPRLILIDDVDRQTRWYYQMKRAYEESRRAGVPFEHPLREAETLRWRNPHERDVLR
jgi:phenylpropionate dioxygenase-like ring-hydroxylating dioxygenase large terminal subunit